jgi:far upstream element-binding protein
MRRVIATGSPEGVARAYQLVQALLEDPQTGQATSNTLVLTGQTSETVLVPNERVGLLIGRGGETIREIQRRANVRVNVTPDSQATVGQSERPVQIIGDLSGVQTARALIQEIIDGTSSLVSRVE